LFSVGGACLLSSCFMPEEPISPFDRGDVQSSQVELGTDYRYQVFFDLSSNIIVGQNLKTDWDLAFDSDDEDYHVVLNSSKFMRAARTGTTEFASVTDTTGAQWRWDDPAGDLKKTAVGEWADFSGTTPVYSNEVYLIDRGTNHLGQHQGFRKLQLLPMQGNQYQVRVANLDGSSEEVITVTKDPTVHFTYVSLATNSIVQIEPPKEEWDLLFTQHLHVFVVDGDTIPYLVTGVLSNRSAAVAADSVDAFADITTTSIPSHDYSSAINAIGYDWKYFDFGTLKYTVKPEKNYVIRDPHGFYFKLHFTDFYNAQGEKGAPAFEFQLL